MDNHKKLNSGDLNSRNSSNLVSTNIREICSNEIKNILNIRKSELAKKYLDNSIDWHPKYTLEIERGGVKHSWFLSSKILGSSHTYIVGFCNIGGELRVRTFWRSNSEGCRRAGLGEEMRSDGEIIISKGQSIKNATYETTTKIDYRVAQKLDMIPSVVDSVLGNHPHSSLPKTPGTTIGHILTGQMSRAVTIDKLFEDYPHLSTCGIFAGKDVNKVINFYKNFERFKLKDFDLDNMKMRDRYSYNHKYLGIIDVFICSTTRNGKPIDIHFARAWNNFPEKFWIDNIVYSDAKINSFGTYDRQINAAPLTTKPIEYIHQAPKDMEKGHQVFGNYVDIRDLYQETPLIVKFKEKFLHKNH